LSLAQSSQGQGENLGLGELWVKISAHLEAHEASVLSLASDSDLEVGPGYGFDFMTDGVPEQRLSNSRDKTLSLDQTALRLLRALDKVLGSNDSLGQAQAQHRLRLNQAFHQNLGIGQSSQSGLVYIHTQALKEACHHLRLCLPLDLASMLPIPSSYTIRRVWTLTANQLQDKTNGETNYDIRSKEEVAMRSLVLALSNRQEGIGEALQARLVRLALAAQILSEHFAEEQGQALMANIDNTLT
jgi:hypothetical protein